MSKDLRDRARKIAETPAPLATQPGPQTLYAPGTSFDWYIIRVVTIDEDDSDNNEMWVHPIGYIDGVALQDNTEIRDGSDFLRAYPPPMVQHECFEPFARALLNRTTAVAITSNPDPSAEDYQDQRDAFDAAIAGEALGSNGYPMLGAEIQGKLTMIPPIWVNRNTTFDDQRRIMWEGSGI